MPDHLHLLVEGQTERSDAKKFMALAKQYSGYYYQHEFKARLWQRYGFERVLRSDQNARDVARYIVENPVRAGLVTKPDDYPFLGSSLYSIPELMEYIQSKCEIRNNRECTRNESGESRIPLAEVGLDERIRRKPDCI
jgi:hypothetical protein